jgi:hypothetical protein
VTLSEFIYFEFLGPYMIVCGVPIGVFFVMYSKSCSSLLSSLILQYFLTLCKTFCISIDLGFVRSFSDVKPFKSQRYISLTKIHQYLEHHKYKNHHHILIGHLITNRTQYPKGEFVLPLED